MLKLINYLIRGSKFVHLIVFQLFFTIGVTVIPLQTYAELPVGSYCQLSIQSMQQQLGNLEELLFVAHQYLGDPEGLSAAETSIQAEFEASTNELMGLYNMTPQEYVLYMGKHEADVEAYWNENPDQKQQLETLSAEVINLVTLYEELKGTPETEVPPLE